MDEHPKGNIFHTPEMFEVYQRAKGHTAELWAAADDGAILALFIPVHISLQKGILRAVTTRAVVHGSVLAVPDERGVQALARLLQAYKSSSGRNALFTELRNVSPQDEFQPLLQEQGFLFEGHLNYLIDLDRPVEAVFQQIGQRTRKNIKKGLNKAVVSVEEVDQEAEIPVCYALLDKTYRAAHVPLADCSLFEAAFCTLRPRKMVRFALAKVGHQAAAASIELLYKDIVYGWYGGMDRSWAAYIPNELLMWDILQWGTKNGFKKYDFGGAGKPDEEYGVRDFKAKFGGVLVNYGRNVWVPNRAIMSLSKSVYKAVRRVFY